MLNLKWNHLSVFLSFLIFTFFIEITYADEEKCMWDNRDKPCLIINKKIPNTSKLNSQNINRIVISKNEIDNIGASDVVGVLETIPELGITRSGGMGQQTSVFFRGANSNHTLVMINGIPINDQSTTQGLHDFGVDFVKTIQQIEIYPGSGASQFGSNAIGGAINIVLTGDYQDKVEYSFDKHSNYDFFANKTFLNNSKTTNIKIASTKNKLISARKSNAEDKDEVKNYTANINHQTFYKNLKFSNTTYIRQTIAEYDNSETNQTGYEGDNKMVTSQFSVEKKNKDSEKSAILYYNGYDREYDERGVIDNYYSNTLGVKVDVSRNLKNTISYGYGLNHRYDWGRFNNRGSYSASTKGNSDNTSLFANVGIDLNKGKNLSLFYRNDNHKNTGENSSYTANLSKKINDRIKIGLTRKIGLRNPTLYELFGTDNYGYSGNKNLRPEKSFTNEIYANLMFSENTIASISSYRTGIRNNIIYSSNRYINDNNNNDLVQRGYNFNLNFRKNNNSVKIFTSIMESKNQDNQSQVRRPNKNFGINVNRDFHNELLGSVRFNLNYRHYGKHFDTHSSTFSRIQMDSTDVVNLGFSKSILNKKYYIKINNVLNEKFQRPHGYNQPERLFNFGIKVTK